MSHLHSVHGPGSDAGPTGSPDRDHPSVACPAPDEIDTMAARWVAHDELAELRAELAELRADVAYQTELVGAIYVGLCRVAERFGRRFGVNIPFVRPRGG